MLFDSIFTQILEPGIFVSGEGGDTSRIHALDILSYFTKICGPNKNFAVCVWFYVVFYLQNINSENICI